MYIEPEIFREQNSNYIENDIMPVIVFTYDEDFQKSHASKMDRMWRNLLKTFNPEKGKPKVKDFQSINPENIEEIYKENDFILSSEHFFIISEIQASELSKNNQKLLKDLEFGIRLLSSDFSELIPLEKYIDNDKLSEEEIEDGSIDEVLEKIDIVLELIKRTQEIKKNREEKERLEELKYEQQQQEQQDEISESLDADIAISLEENNSDEETEEENNDVTNYQNELTDEEKEIDELENHFDDDYEEEEDYEEEYQEGDFLESNLKKLKDNINEIVPINNIEFEGYDFEDDEYLDEYPVLKSILYNGNVNRLNRTTELNEQLFQLRAETIQKLYNMLGEKVENNLESINKRTTVVSANDIKNGASKVNNPFQEKMEEIEKQAFDARELLLSKKDTIYQRNKEEYDQRKEKYLEQEMNILQAKYDQEHLNEVEEKTSEEYDSFANELQKQFIESQNALIQKADNEFLRLNDGLIAFVLKTNKEDIDKVLDEYSEKYNQYINDYNKENQSEKEYIDYQLNENVNDIIQREQDVNNRVQELTEERLLEKDNEINEVKNENIELSKKYHNRESDIIHYQEQYQKGLSELKDYKDENNRLKDENNHLKEQYNIEIEKRNQQLEETNKKVEELTNTINDKEEREKQTIENNQNLETMRLNQKNSSQKLTFVAIITSALLACGTILGVATMNSNNNNEQNSQQTQYIEKLQKELDEQKEQNSQLENQVSQNSQSEELEKTKDELNKAKNEINDLKDSKANQKNETKSSKK